MPHPDADRLVLCKLDDGERVHTVLTGALVCSHIRQGGIGEPIKVAYAREGAVLYDVISPATNSPNLNAPKSAGRIYSMAAPKRTGHLR